MRRRIVLTGGPGAGKTALLELIRQYFCEHMKVLPEAASILFSGGFPRGESAEERRAVQRAIYHVQRELERAADAEGRPAIVLCDRGTVDGAAYWHGPAVLWDEVGTRHLDELARYDAVVHMRSPSTERGYDHSNPVRTESADEAARIDERILKAWEEHPRRLIVESTTDFLTKVERAVGILREEMPPCCRPHLEPEGRP